MRVAWIVLVALLATALAGCSEDRGADPAEPTGDFGEFELEATDDTGVIRGIVVNQAVAPIAGVDVTLTSMNATVTSNAGGAFGFSKVEPGSHFIVASKAGFITTTTSVTVVAGDDHPPVVRVLLEGDPAARPYSQIVPFNGFIACSFTLVLVSFAACGADPVASAVGNSFLQNVEFDRVPSFVQSEMTWESTQSLGDAMSMSWTDPRGGQTRINATAGASPMRTTFDQALFEEMELLNVNLWLRVFSTSREGTDVVQEETWNAPWRDSVYPLLNTTPVPGVAQTVADSSFGLLLNPIGEDCVKWVVLFNACMGVGGVGVTLDQPFTIYTTSFYGFTPEDDWWFITHGEPTPP